MHLNFYVRHANGEAEYACSLDDAKRIGASGGTEYRVFGKQRGKWHMVYSSENGY